MSYDAIVYEVLIASPSDVTEERVAISKAIHTWNAANSRDLKAVLLPIRWETHATPGMEGRPQAIINKQLVKPSDILVGVFWSRIGTDTKASESGTLEEIEEFKRANKPVLIYFSHKLIPRDADLLQLDKVRKFETKIMDNQLGLIDSFSSTSELVDKLKRHLTDKVRILKNSYSSAELDEGPETTSSIPAEKSEEMLSKLTERECLVLLAFLVANKNEMVTAEIKKFANSIAQKNNLEQIQSHGIGGVITGFTQDGKLKNMKILHKGIRARGGSLYSIDEKWLPFLLRLQQNLKWEL